MAELSVQLRADIKTFLKSIERVEKELLQTGEAAENTAKKTSKAFSGTAPKQVRGFTKEVANATPALQEFSRVIQDAPFGIQGVGNNIQQLTANFGNLSRSAGGPIAALKLMFGALAGPAGILLAVSAVTSALTVFGDKLFSSKNKAEELAKEIERVTDSMDIELKLSESIEDNLIAQGKETKGILKSRRELIGEQITTLEGLIKEQQALVNIKKLQNETVSNLEIIAQLSLKVAAAVAVIARGLFEETKAVTEIRDKFADMLGISIDRSKFSAATAEDRKEEQKLVDQLRQLEIQRLDLATRLLETEKQITGEKRSQVEAIGATAGRGITASLDNLGSGVLGQIITPGLQTRVATGLEGITQELLDFNNRANNIISGSIVNTFAGIGDAIFGALASGENVFSALGQSLLQSFGRFLSEMGAALISYGLLAKQKGILDIAIAAGGPFAIIAGAAAIKTGALLVAAGAVFGAIAGAGFGGGGGSSRVAGQGSTGSNTSFTGGTSSFSGDGTVVFEISGNSLVGVLNRTLGKNGRLGGNLSIG